MRTFILKYISPSYGLFTFTDPDSDCHPNSKPIPVLGIWDGNLNLTPRSAKSSAYVAIWFAVWIWKETESESGNVN